MGQVLSNLISIIFGRKQKVYHAPDDHCEEVKPIHPTSGYGKTRVSEEDEGSVVVVITDADQVREDVAEPFPLVSGEPNTRVSKDEWVAIIVDSGVEAVEKIKPATDAEVRVDAEPFPLLSVNPKTRVSEYERAREDLEPFLLVSVDPKPRVSEDEKVREDVAEPFPLVSGDPETRVSEDERVITIIVDSGVEAVEKIKPIHHVSTVPKYGSGAKRRKRRAKRKERRIKHYYSSHKLLLVGEGDFSFSACLAKVFGSANNMVPTSLNSKGFLEENYCNAISNINGLKSRGCMVLHGLDATNMSAHQILKSMTFDRIVFNFPYAGFFKNEPRESQKSRHRMLVTLFFQNAKKMLSKEGEIHISHKSNGFHREWNIISLASLSGLKFIKKVKFNLNDYQGYNTKRGFGGDENFDCNPSETYMFGLIETNG